MPRFIRPSLDQKIKQTSVPTSTLNIRDLELSVRKVKELIENGLGKVLVITGAGVSVDSGIRAYRGSKGSYTVNKSFRPIFYQFVFLILAFRKRYWARSYLGYPTVRLAKPNQGHLSIAALMKMGLISNLITQNVDRLHHKALMSLHDSTDLYSSKSSHPQVIELHGTLNDVICLSCGHILDRDTFQDKMSELNPSLKDYADSMAPFGQKLKTNPDGDFDLGNWSYDLFQIPSCENCSSSMLKPAVTFFGESLSDEIKRRCEEVMDRSSNLLLVGTSLTTYSAFRLVKYMRERSGTKIGMINIGISRADGIVDWKIGSDDDNDDSLNAIGCSQVLREVELEFCRSMR
ncbi:DHS-like NAD/FAD-binding domain-containing protein [Phakopsora pachyrhizi]|uniref:DHS-like NAD/FAD-binding domain-containing protein n=1 Tax=Phakopsora pachyrhizi TaxID=170000 RepID=A0AAV0AGD0_PHAPC|nr:DHS-like NAD/FAD-binding domain-containing protein [Phakopsora pachyrhizi]